MPALPRSYRRLFDGGTVAIGSGERRSLWTCHAGFGHAPEHMALHDAAHGVLISGDMVLPRISTNVSVIDIEPEADSLTLYLDSIERMRAIPADVLVLPSHGRPFKGLHTRIDQLQAHHDARFVDVLEALAAKGPQSAFELRAGDLPPAARPAPDDLRDGRVDRPHARALVPRQAGAPARRRRRLPVRARRLRRPEPQRPRAARSGPRWRS